MLARERKGCNVFTPIHWTCKISILILMVLKQTNISGLIMRFDSRQITHTHTHTHTAPTHHTHIPTHLGITHTKYEPISYSLFALVYIQQNLHSLVQILEEKNTQNVATYSLLKTICNTIMNTV